MNNIILNSPKDNTLIYNEVVTVNYVLENPDINFYAINFFLNGVLVKTVTSFKGNFSLLTSDGINNLKAYCVNKDLKTLPNTEINISFENLSSIIVKKNESNKLLQFQLPEFIKEDYPQFVEFLKEYYKFLEKSNDPNLVPYNLENYRDIDSVSEHILDKIKYELMQDFDVDISKDVQTGSAANYRNLLKNIKEFYDSKGTENSIKFLFRILFDKEAEIYYPKTDILRLSDGKWSDKTYLRIRVSTDEEAFSYVNGTVYQLNSSGTKTSEAKIRSVVTTVTPAEDGLVGILELDEINGTFTSSGNTTYIKIPINGVETDFQVIKINISNDKRYITNDGWLSSKKFLHDNDYYQEYSYDVQSDVAPSKFIEIVKKLTHTAGTRVFSSALLTKKLNSTYNNVGVEVKNNGQIILAHFMGYSPSSKQDLNALEQDGGTTYDAFPQGYFFGEDGSSLYIPATGKTLTAEETVALNYTINVTTIYAVDPESMVPVEEEPPGSSELETTDESGTVNDLVTHKYTNSILIDFDFVNYIPESKQGSYRDYWVPGKHFKSFAKRDGVLQDTNANLTIGEFTIEELFDSQKEISDVVVSQSDVIQTTLTRKNILNENCKNQCSKLYNVSNCFQQHLGQFNITDTEKPTEGVDNYEFKLERWKAYQNCMNPYRICIKNCEENYPTGVDVEDPVDIDE